MTQETKRGKDQIDMIKYLPRAHMIAFLSGQVVSIVGPDLSFVQEFKNRKVVTFCINTALYRTKESVVDQICIATDKNYLFFYESDMTSGALLFKEDTKPPLDKGYFIGATPSQLFWDGDRIYFATKRAYAIMNKNTGDPIYKFDIDSKGKSQSHWHPCRNANDVCIQRQMSYCLQLGQKGPVY